MSVFVLRALGIGDLATAVPALRGLRAVYPSRRLELGAPQWLAPLAALSGAVDRLVPVDGLPGPGRRLPVQEPMVAVNLHGRGPQSHRALLATRPGELLAFGNEEAGVAGPPWRPDEHEVARWCRLLDWYGIPCAASDLRLRVPQVPAPVVGATIVHPGAKDPQRRWPAGRFAAVAGALHRAGHRVVVTGGPTEAALAGRVAHAAGLPDDRVLAGRTHVGDLAALVAAARVVVSGDTGIAHLATGYGTPSVTLFHRVSPALWGPPPELPWHRPLWLPEAAHPLGAISSEQVLATVDAVLAAVAGDDRAARAGHDDGPATAVVAGGVH